MIYKILNSVYAKPVAVFLAANMFILSAFSADRSVVLSSATPVILETIAPIHSDSCAIGDIFEVKVRHDVYADDDIVIAEGTMATAQIERVQQSKSIGKAGYVELVVKEVPAVDGQMVSLTGGSIYRDGDGREVEAIVLGVFICLLFLILKGDPATIPSGTLVNASTAGSLTIAVP